MKARIATKATTAAMTAPVWLRMRMRSGSAAGRALAESVLVLGSDEQPQRWLGCFHCTGAMPRRRACVKWCSRSCQRAALLRLEPLASVLQAASLASASAARRK